MPQQQAADELIHERRRDYTPDPIQRWLIEHASAVVRGIDAGTRDEAINQLITQLGGDPRNRELETIGWGEAVRVICTEMREGGKAETYVANTARMAADLAIITGLQDWSKLDLDAIARYRSVRLAGGWKRGKRTVHAVQGRTINSELGALSAFLTRAVRKNWIARNVLEGEHDLDVKIKSERVPYMPDADLRKLIETASEPWLRTFVILAYYTGARRSDVLQLEWETDIDLDGTKVAVEGRTGPHIYIRGSKADTPHWLPLHPSAVKALEVLRREPLIDRVVFPLKHTTNPRSCVSHAFAALCVKAGITCKVDRNGKTVVKNRWKLHDLRRKSNTDLRNGGASPKERATLLGQRTTAVNESHYEATLAHRERELIDGLPSFGLTG